MVTKFKDIHPGGTCFIVGNGSSLRASDLDKIQDTGLPTFATNAIAKMFDRTIFRPWYYVCVSTAFEWAGYQDAFIKAMQTARMNFVWDRFHIGDDVPHVCYLNCVDTEDKTPENPWSDHVETEVSKWGSSLNVAAQIAAYMGFKRIYFIGMTGYYTVKKHFDGYVENEDVATISNEQAHITVNREIAKNFARLGIEAYNLSRKTQYDAYPRMRLEDALDSIRE